MKGIEVTLSSPISAKRFGEILSAIDIIHQAEFVVKNGRLPGEGEAFRVRLVSGSIKIQGVEVTEGISQGMVEWIKATVDPRFRKFVEQELEKRDKENALLDGKIDRDRKYTERKERLEIESRELENWDHKLRLLDKVMTTAERIGTFDQVGAQQFVSRMLHALGTISDAEASDEIVAHRYGLLE